MWRLITVFLLAHLVCGANADFLGFRMNYQSHDDYTLDKYDHYPNHTLVCYQHVLRDPQSIDAHRYRMDGAPDFAISFRFPVSHLEYDEIALIDVISIELDEIPSTNCTDSFRQYGDGFRLAWSEFVGWPAWTEFPMPCGTDQEQRFGVSMHSFRDWGREPRTSHNGLIYRAHSGRESPDAVIQRLNKAHRKDRNALQHFVLTAYMRSGNPIRIRALNVRKCLVEPLNPNAIEAMRNVDAAQRLGVEIQLASALQSMPVALVPDEIAPKLLPLRSAAWEDSTDGTCFVELGWINAWPYTVNASDCHAGNCLQPRDVADYVFMPQHFAPGWYRNYTRIAWRCHGWRPGLWRTLRWTLAHGIVQVDHTTPLEHIDHFLWGQDDISSDIPAAGRYSVMDGNLVQHQVSTHLEYWRIAHGHQPQPEISMESMLVSHCAWNNFDCEKPDDAAATLQFLQLLGVFLTIGVVIIVVIVILGYIFGFQIDPVKLLWLVLIIALVFVGLIGFNFLFASRLNRPNGVERPPSFLDLAGVQGSPLDNLQPAAGLPSVPDSPNIPLPPGDIPAGVAAGYVPGPGGGPAPPTGPFP